MRDQVLPPSFGKCKLISGGATGWVFEPAPGIAVKYICTGRGEEFRRENETYDLIERNNPPPYFIQSFLRLPYAHFMQRMACSLDSRLESNQRRDLKKRICLQVLRLEPTAKIEQWAAELSGALAWLESLGLVQGDLRPPNLLLDGDDHLKLADFDSCAKIGTRDPGLPPPWSLIQYKPYGAKSEQFAFASILYYMTHGVEPHEDKGSGTLKLFRASVFPELSESRLDVLTLRCWKGEFKTLADLSQDCATLDGAKTAARASTTDRDDEYMSRMKRTCEELLRTKLADLGQELPKDVREGKYGENVENCELSPTKSASSGDALPHAATQGKPIKNGEASENGENGENGGNGSFFQRLMYPAVKFGSPKYMTGFFVHICLVLGAIATAFLLKVLLKKFPFPYRYESGRPVEANHKL